MKINVYTDKNLLSYLAKGWSEDKLISGKIKTLTGKTITIENAEISWSVFQFKRAIEDKEGIPVEKQTIKKGKTVLEDKQFLSEYFLTDGTTLLMFIEGEGVDYTPPSEASASGTRTKERTEGSKIVVLDPSEEGEEKDQNENWWEKSQMSGPKSAPKLTSLIVEFDRELAKRILLNHNVTRDIRNEVYTLAKRNNALSPSFVGLSLIVFAREKDSEAIKEAIDQAVKDGVMRDPEWNINLAVAYAKQNNKTQAMNVLNDMKRDNHFKHVDLHSFAFLASGVGGSREGFDWCLKEFSNIPEERKKNKGLMAQAYGVLMSCAGKLEDFQKQQRLFVEMRKQGLKPDIMPYTSLIDGYAKKGEMENALAVKLEMKKQGVKADIIIYNKLIHGFVKKEEMENALAVKLEMEKQEMKPDIATYNILINGYIKKREMENALAVKFEMENRGIKPTNVTYINLIDGYAKKGEMENALAVKLEMKKQGVKADNVTYNKLVHGFVKKEEMENALAVKLEMEKQEIKPDIATYNILISGYIKKGEMVNALAVKFEMEKRGIKPTNVTYRSLIDGYAMNGEMENALAVIIEMKKEGIKADAAIYNSLIVGFQKTGETEKATLMQDELSKWEQLEKLK